MELVAQDERHDLRFTLGAIEIGMVLAVFLTGIATLQVWNYARDYPTDSKRLKILVAAVYLADTVHSVLLVHGVYSYTILDFADYEALEYLTKSMTSTVFITGLIAFSVQSYYCLRVQRVTHSWIVTCVCWVLSALRFVFAFMIAVAAVKRERYDTFAMPDVRWKLAASLCMGTASDILIAGFICASILRMRSGLAASDKVVDKLVAFTIASGLLTSIVAVGEMTTFLSMNNFVFITFYCMIAKLFANSLFASLNERSHHQRSLDAWTSRRTGASSTRMTFEREPQTVAVELTTVQEEFGDEDHAQKAHDRQERVLQAV